MRFAELDLKSYGRFEGARITLPSRSNDFHLIFGENEAGKSTIRNAIQEVLFGFDERTPFAFGRRYGDLLLGAMIESGDQTLSFLRRKGRKNTVRSSVDDVLDDAVLHPFLGATDRALHDRFYNLDQALLLQGQQHLLDPDDQIGRLIMGGGSGLSHLHDLIDTFRETAEQYYTPRKKGGVAFHDAKERFDEVSGRIRTANTTIDEYNRRLEGFEAARQALENLGDRSRNKEIERGRIERRRQLGPLLLKLDAARNELKAAGELAGLPKNANDLIAQARERLRAANHTETMKRSELDKHRERMETTVRDPAVLEYAAAIDAMSEHDGRAASVESDITNAKASIAQDEAQIREKARSVSIVPEDVQAIVDQLPSPERLEALRYAIDRDRELEGKEEERQTAVRDAKRALGRIDARLPEEVAPWTSEKTDALRLLGDLRSQQDRRDEHAAEREAARQRMETLIQSLAPSTVTADNIESIRVPNKEKVRSVSERLRRVKEEHLARLREREEIEQGIAKLQAEIASFKRSDEVVTDEELQHARQKRDRIWESICSEPGMLEAQAPVFRSAMDEADQFSDSRYRNAEAATSIAAREAQIEQLKARNASREALDARYREELREVEADWANVVTPLGLAEFGPEDFEGWHDRLLEARQQAAQLSEQSRKLSRADDAIASCIDQVSHLLGKDTSSDVASEYRILQKQEAAARQYEAALTEYRSSRQEAKERLETAEAALSDHQYKRSEAVDGLKSRLDALGWEHGLPSSAYIERIRIVEGLRQQCANVQEKHLSVLNPLLERWDSFKEEVARIAQALDIDVSERPREQCMRLIERLKAAREAERRFADATLAYQEAKDVIEAAQRDATSVRGEIQPLLETACVSDLDALEEAILREEHIREMQSKRDQAEAEFKEHAVEQSEQEVRDLVKSMSLDEATAQLAQINDELEQLRDERDLAVAAEQEARRALDAVAAATEIPELTAEKAAHARSAATALERYFGHSAARLLLEEALRRYKEANQSPTLQRASVYFSAMTQGRYGAVQVDDTQKQPLLVVKEQGSGSTKRLVELSEGTRDQFLLALRFGALEMHFQHAPALPLVCDDLLVNADNTRAAQMLQVLHDFSSKTQVLLLTHHHHLVEIARNVLEAPSVINIAEQVPAPEPV